MSMIDKPVVQRKVRAFIKNVKNNGGTVGKIPRSIVLNYNNACNLHCDFCYSADKDNKYLHDCLSLDTIEKLADQADELGIWEIILTGGELLINPNQLMKIIQAFKPERFMIEVITNGYLMTPELAVRLAENGLDCVGVSISGLDADEHDRARGIKGSHERALNALRYVKEAGMAAWPMTIYGHHNAHSKDLEDFLTYSDKMGYTTYFMMAMPYGAYKDNLMDSSDIERLAEIRKTHNCYFDTWDMFDKNKKREKNTGCWTVNRCFVTPHGDVFPCPFINIKIGNILEKPLKEILDYGFSIKYFGNYSPICISAFNKKFRDTYLPENRTLFDPYDAKDIFKEGDYLPVE